MPNVLANLFSWADGVKRRASSPLQTIALGLQRGTEDLKEMGRNDDIAYGLNGMKSVLISDAQKKEAAQKAAEFGLNMGMAGVTTGAKGYRGEHRAPMKDSGAPLHDLTGGGKVYPDDVYSINAARYYGSGDAADNQAFAIAQQLRGKPNAPVTMYRAVPKEMTNAEQLAQLEKDMSAFMKRGKTPQDSSLKGSDWYNDAWERRNALQQAPATEAAPKPTINNGDWVTLSREYAKQHGIGALNGQYQILSQKVPARKLFTNGDSIQEFGYDESGRITANMLATLAGGTAAGLGAYEMLRGDK